MDDYDRIATAIRYIQANRSNQPTLAEIAGAAGLSPAHFQRLFRRWAGVSPKRLLQCLTLEHAKALLKEPQQSVLDTAMAVGLSGPGRLHDHFVRLEATTPGEYGANGAGLEIRWGMGTTPFGPAFLAQTQRGICRLAFPDSATADDSVKALTRLWPQASFVHDPAATAAMLGRVFRPSGANSNVLLHIHGTNFQFQVWRALLTIPSGEVTSYGTLARRIDRPRAARAVGSAVGANPVAFLIPCHRVLRSLGELGGYHWGIDRKQAMLAWEAAQRPSNAASASARSTDSRSV
ncbi:MAG: methylated-DNA--[protein]-cysteine S-methyltransferase [Pseudomonadota bacterium]|nr:methylated-DNA--[protein]-cysteine S-methyltransferase [Pseudomonadota bacterium]